MGNSTKKSSANSYSNMLSCFSSHTKLRSEDLIAKIILSLTLNKYSYFDMLRKLKKYSRHNSSKTVFESYE